MKAMLVLANGMVFEGKNFGAQGTRVGEVVFNTGMVGYEETLTDPSYYGQIITQAYPLVGNYGVNGEDAESDRIWAFGYIVREACETPSNFRSKKTLDAFLKEQNIIGLEGIDTRRLVRVLRDWFHENARDSRHIYELVGPNEKLDKNETKSFINHTHEYAERQILRAGYRLAKVLNDLFG